MKKWKWFLVIVLVMFLAIGGTALYFLKFKTYDVADENVDAVLEEHFELELPDGKVIVVDADGNIVEEKTTTVPTETTPTPLPVGAKVNEDGATVTLPDGQVVANDTTLPAGATVSEQGVATLPTGETTQIEYVTPTQNGETTTATGDGSTQTTDDASTAGENASTNDGTVATDETPQINGETSGGADDNNEGSAPNTSGGTTTSTPPAANGKPTVSDIKNKYASSFDSLESQATAKLNSLIGTAKSEYVQSQQSGEGVSYAYFYQKYYGAAMSLEANTDSAFNALLAVVKSDLQQNGYDATYANSFVTEYEAAKKAREASILNQIK